MSCQCLLERKNRNASLFTDGETEAHGEVLNDIPKVTMHVSGAGRF